MQKIKIGLIGYGTIGSGVADLLENNKQTLSRKTGIEFELKTVVDLDTVKLNQLKEKGINVSSDYKSIINDPEIDIVVELAGGVDFPWQVYQDTVQSSKHFITANKALLSKKLRPMFELAKKHQKYIGYEASVAGGIPIISTLRNSLVGNKIISIEGIINGTTNYILTQMEEKGISFAEALKSAQELGFAEADPTLDINGGDAASKIAILASISYGQNIEFGDVSCQGIENIELEDIQDANELGYSIKLLAMCSIDESENVSVRVHPTLVSPKNPLSAVKNEFNAILVNSDFLGESMYYGKGAGSYPTTSAVVADIAEIGVKTRMKKEFNNSFYSLPTGKNIKPIDEIQSRYYVRIMTKDKPGILGQITSVLGESDISICSLVQKRTGNDFVPVVFTSHTAKEKDFQSAVRQIESFDFVDSVVYYRIVD